LRNYYMSRHYSRTVLMAGFTAVFIGYLSVWLPGPAAGLSFIGVEMGEWIKFMGMGPVRNWFYLPPITLGLMLALWTMGWPNGRWHTWLLRGTAVLVSLLAFPAIEDLLGDSVSEYTPRVAAIGLVVLAAAGVGFMGHLRHWRWLLLGLLGLAGAFLPLWVYLQVQPAVSTAVGLPIGIGWGVWLNGLGHFAVTAVSLNSWRLEIRG
jgi:hypothetical protein